MNLRKKPIYYWQILFVITLIISGSSSYSQLVSPAYNYGSMVSQREFWDYQNRLYKNSEANIDSILKTYPETPELDKLYLQKAQINYVLGYNEFSDKYYFDFIEKRRNSPLLPFAYYSLASNYYQKQNYQKSEYYFNQAAIASNNRAKMNPDERYSNLSHRALFFRSVSISLQGRLNEAIESFKDMVEKEPNGIYTDDGLYSIAQSYENSRRYEEAIEAYKRIRINYPKSNVFVASYIREADNYLQLRNPSSATINLERAEDVINSILKKDSLGKTFEPQTFFENSRETILYLRGEAANMAHNFDKALVYFNSFFETFSSSNLTNNSRLGIAWTYLNLGDYKKSLEFYREILKSDNKNDEYIKQLAEFYRTIALKKSGDLDQAQRELSALSVKSTHPLLGQILLELGQIYYEQKDYIAARKTLERADREAIDPVTTARIYLMLGASYLELGMTEKALAIYYKAEQLISNSNEVVMPQKKLFLSEARFKQGISLVQTQRSREAITKLNAFLAESGNDSRREEGLFWLAESYYKNDLMQNSIKSYTELLEQYPNTSRKEEALYGLGWSYFRIKNFVKSSETFDKMINSFPKSKFAVEVLTRQGDGYYLSKNYKLAIESYSRASKMGAGSDEALYCSYQLCQSLYMSGQYERAISALLSFVSSYKSSNLAPNAMYLIGWIRFQQKRYNEAIDNFKYMIEAYPQSLFIPNAHYSIADCFYNLESYEKAMSSYKVVVESYPSDALAPEAMRGVQQCLVLLGRESEAVEVINNYTSKNQESPFYHDFKQKAASILFGSGKYSDAVSEYDKLIQKFPNSAKNAESIYWMGRSYANMENYTEAEKAFIKVQKSYSESEYASLSIYENAMMKKKISLVEKADSLLYSVVKLYPTSPIAPQAAFERAVLKFQIGDSTKSIELYYMVADSFPNSDFGTESRYRIAKFFRLEGKNDSSRKEFEKLIKVSSNKELSAEAQYRIGELFQKEKQLDSAIVAFEKVKNNYSSYEDWFSLSLLNLGEIYEEVENFDKSREVYAILSELRPNDDFGKTAKRRLTRLPKKK